MLPIRAVLINAIIKTGETLALRVEGRSPLFGTARKLSCKFYITIELAKALGQSDEILKNYTDKACLVSPLTPVEGRPASDVGDARRLIGTG